MTPASNRSNRAMRPILKPPIILLGNVRSGTTMVQRVLSTHPDVTEWYEPNPIWLYPDPRRVHDEFDERDATERARRYIRGRFVRYQIRHGNRIVMEKSPQNILRIPYVRAVFPEAAYLFIVRHPFAFINSVEAKWQKTVTLRGIVRRLKSTPVSQLPYWVQRYARQQFEKRVLGRKYLSIWGPKYRGIHEDLRTLDRMTVIARQWSECSRKAEAALARFGDGEVLRLRYEDFVQQPIEHLEQICGHCGLVMTDPMVERARALVRTDRLDGWRRFDPAELARLLPELESEMLRHGYEVPPEVAALSNGHRPAA